MMFKIFSQVYSVYSLIGITERDQILEALKKTANLKEAPVKIQIHSKDPNTLNPGEEPLIIGTIKPVLQNPLLYLYEAEKALIDLCEGKEVFAVLYCPDIKDDINYTSYFQPNWSVQIPTAHPVKKSVQGGNIASTTVKNIKDPSPDPDRDMKGDSNIPDEGTRRAAELERLRTQELIDQREIRKQEAHGDQRDRDAVSDAGIEDANDDDHIYHDGNTERYNQFDAPVIGESPLVKATNEVVTKYIVYKSPTSPKEIIFGVYMKPVFSVVSIQKPLLPNVEYEVNISKNASIPQSTLDQTFEYTNIEGGLEIIKFKYTKAYPDTEKLISEFLDISLQTIHTLMTHGIQNIKQALIPALKVLGNMRTREQIRVLAGKCSGKRSCLSSNQCIEKTPTPCETNKLIEQPYDYSLITTLSKYQITVCNVFGGLPGEYKYTPSETLHLKKTFQSIFRCNSMTSIQAVIKAHLFYVWSKGRTLEINCGGLLETENFVNCFNWEVLNTENIEEKACLKIVGCPVQENLKSKDSKSTTDKSKISENDETENDEENNSDNDDNRNTNKKRSNTILYVSIAVVVVCVTSIAVYYVLA